MSDGSKIEWTDATWNPVIGCTKVSPGCDNCYAIRTAHRMQANPNPKVSGAYAGTEADGEWTGRVNLLGDKLDKPLQWRKPRRIFVNSQSDLFHDRVTDEFIARVWAVMTRCPQHTFQILTKRHGRMRSLLNSDSFIGMIDLELGGDGSAEFFRRDVGWPLDNVWLGVSVEDQQRARLRGDALTETPAAVRFWSAEPLLGAVDATPWLPSLDWVICGGESGPGARPMHPDWARSLRDQCVTAGVPFLFKQWGDWRYAQEFDDITVERVAIAEGWWEKYPNVSAYSVWPDGSHSNTATPEPGVTATMQRVGKRAAGRMLDGRTWDEHPEGGCASRT